MASFEMFSMRKKEETTPLKFPIKSVDMAIQKFLKVLEIDLERLERHQTNIEKFQKSGDLKALNKEQINASRTVQAITQNIKEVEQTRNQVLEKDLEEFDSKVMGMKTRAVTDLVEFRNMNGSQEVLACQSLNADHPAAANTPDNSNEIYTVESDDQSSEVGTDGQVQEQLRLEAEQCAQVEQSWNDLEQNLVELNSLIRDFSEVVHSQKQTVDSIEDNVETAQVNVEEGTHYLAKAAKYKTTLMPVAGAILGGVVAGPVGLVAGLKLGGLAAVGGGIVGFTSGSYIKRAQQAQIDNDMIDIKERREQKEDVENDTDITELKTATDVGTSTSG